MFVAQGQGHFEYIVILGILAFSGSDERRDPRKVRRVLRNTLAARMFSFYKQLCNQHTANSSCIG
jgi:hypothetical protein